MANWQHTGGDPLDYHNYNLEGEDDEGCGSMLFAIIFVVIIFLLMWKCQ